MEHINHTPWQIPCPGAVGQCKIDSVGGFFWGGDGSSVSFCFGIFLTVVVCFFIFVFVGFESEQREDEVGWVERWVES